MPPAQLHAAGRGLHARPQRAHALWRSPCNHSARLHARCAAGVTTPANGTTHDVCDLVLSSGFLAFASHAGFLHAVEEAGLTVGGVMGTSAGALTGSLYCAGYTPQQVARHLSDQAPASLLRPSLAPWRGGALSLEGVVERLRDLLPPTFEELQREFAVGVVTADGRHLLIDSGPLPEAVAASAAIPFVFEAVDVPGHARHGPFKDGGVVDRVGLVAWRNRRRSQSRHVYGTRPPTCLVHVIERSSPFSGADDMSATGESHVVVVRSPRSGANFFDLGAFHETMTAASDRAKPHLHRVRGRRGGAVRASSNGNGSSGGGSSSAVNGSGSASALRTGLVAAVDNGPIEQPADAPVVRAII